MAAAILPQDDSPPKVARKLSELLARRHWLLEVRQEVRDGLSLHFVPPLSLALAAPGRAPSPMSRLGSERLGGKQRGL
jgi:hypothetical protein